MRKTSLFTLVACAAAIAGCGGESSPTLSGTVHFDGQPISKGSIVFIPVGGNGTPFAGDIRDGKYFVEKAYPGKRTVSIGGIMGGESSSPVTRESVERGTREGKKAAEQKTVPENAVGNMQEIEVKAGKQVFDFKLTSPAK